MTRDHDPLADHSVCELAALNEAAHLRFGRAHDLGRLLRRGEHRKVGERQRHHAPSLRCCKYVRMSRSMKFSHTTSAEGRPPDRSL